MIGAGGVATVAAFKIAQNADVFTDFMIASRRKAKCDKIVDDIHNRGYQMNIQTAQVDADDVEQLKALFNSYQPDLVINLALPYQDLTDHGRLSGMRLQLSRHRQLRTKGRGALRVLLAVGV